jgi:MFS family permease
MPENFDIQSMHHPTNFKNRKTGLTIFGIILIILGALSALTFLLILAGTLIGRFVSAPTSAPLLSMIVGISMYGILAIIFIWLGIGSINAKRWSRALILIGAWYSLIVGIVSVVFIAYIMPDIWTIALQDSETPVEAIAFVRAFTYSLLGFLTIILPLAFILFYQNKHVKETCEHLDPHERWTDRSPLPVLALSLIFVYSALFTLVNISYGGIFPLFGFIITGSAGGILNLVLMIFSILIAWGIYKLEKRAWWGALGITVGGTLSYIITILFQGLIRLYEKMNWR